MSQGEAPGFRSPSQLLPELTGLATILDAISREVTSAARATCELQETLSPLLCTLGQDECAIKDIQALDLIAQQLHGVADFLNALVPTLPAEWAGDATAAARAVSLSNLAGRLSGQQDTPNSAADHADSTFELFDV